jgi:hypothetical protein
MFSLAGKQAVEYDHLLSFDKQGEQDSGPPANVTLFTEGSWLGIWKARNLGTLASRTFRFVGVALVRLPARPRAEPAIVRWRAAPGFASGCGGPMVA